MIRYGVCVFFWQISVEPRKPNHCSLDCSTWYQSASFGPFDRQVVILNEDGKGFTLLQNPQAMRLKRDGLIKDRQFVRQPTEEELEKALEAEGPSLGEAFQGLLGGQ